MLSIYDAVSRFLIAKEAEGLKLRTLHVYNERLIPFMFAVGEGTPLADVTLDDVDAYIVKLRRRKTKHVNSPFRPSENGSLSDATVNGVIEVLKGFFRWCEERRYIGRSPAGHLRKKRRSNDSLAHGRAMDPDDLVKMLAYLELAAKARNWVDIRDLALLALTADSLARRGEVSSLNLDSIDFNKSFVDDDGQVTYQAEVDGKVGKRLITFSEQTALYLLDWLDIRPAVEPDEGGEPFFVNLCRWHRKTFKDCTSCENAGRRLSSQAIYRIFKRLGKRAGIEGRVNPHAVRHLGGIQYAEQAGIEVAQEKLGHTSIKTTRDFYVPNDMNRVRKATGKLSLVQKRKRTDNPDK